MSHGTLSCFGESLVLFLYRFSFEKCQVQPWIVISLLMTPIWKKCSHWMHEAPFCLCVHFILYILLADFCLFCQHMLEMLFLTGWFLLIADLRFSVHLIMPPNRPKSWDFFFYYCLLHTTLFCPYYPHALQTQVFFKPLVTRNNADWIFMSDHNTLQAHMCFCLFTIWLLHIGDFFSLFDHYILQMKMFWLFDHYALQPLLTWLSNCSHNDCTGWLGVQHLVTYVL